jgi:hypothetical protein
MADNQLYTLQAAFLNAGNFKTILTGSKLRLCQFPLVIGQSTTKAEMVAAEANFDGYPAGGYTLSTWGDPLTYPGGGAVITSPAVTPTYGPAGAPPVGNSISAWWIEDSIGGIRTAGNFDPARPMSATGDGFPFIDQIVIGRNAQVG